VTSFGGPSEGGHLALNYWFHPPDNLQPGPAGFRQPYSSGYWPALWADRLQRLRLGGAGAAAAAATGGHAAAAGGEAAGRQQQHAGEESGGGAQRVAGGRSAAAEVLQGLEGAEGLGIDKDAIRQLLQQYFAQGGQQGGQQQGKRRRKQRPVGRRHHLCVRIKDSSRAMMRPPRPLLKR
jgi:hypothetical protein